MKILIDILLFAVFVALITLIYNFGIYILSVTSWTSIDYGASIIFIGISAKMILAMKELSK